MNVKELIDYLNTLPCDTKITCCQIIEDKYVSLPPREVDVTNEHLTYTPEAKTLKIGYFISW